MTLKPPIEPMLAKPTSRSDPFLALTDDVTWRFEPKWDGFRTMIFKDGDELYLQSREKKPLLRYFPELDAPLRAQLPERCVLDGELVIKSGHGLDFEALQLRIHPAKSRIDKLAQETPARFVAFDILAEGDDDLQSAPYDERRARLIAALRGARPPIYVTPQTSDIDVARDWFERFEGAGFDGVIAKPSTLTYQPKKRVMIKLKHRRTADCVLAGFRWHKNGRPTKTKEGTLVGSLMLGLYDSGALQSVGITSSFKMDYRAELVDDLAPLRTNALDGHPWASWAAGGAGDDADTRRPGMQSRWSRGRSMRWEPLRIERVVEVKYDQVQSGRFRHTASFVRFRTDREPASCTFEQIATQAPQELDEIFE